ncbi:hypothetical protein CALCODRAFT_510337 [Calocera cornea HHB12733]|uniref:N-acetyltransferase domain-containing protein n=1 Tax=Calocera cornea HHB12733 TaxID=1353952 RepID=A0A165ELN3_9BASI|nr:hypothetical protein CALCODRAFT_510337 [Calocera cornea HHB12733]
MKPDKIPVLHSLLAQTQLLTRAFENDTFFHLMLGPHSRDPQLLEAYMRLKAVLVMDEGDWWVAQLETTGEIVGWAPWFPPGTQWLGTPEQLCARASPSSCTCWTRKYAPREAELCNDAFGENAQREHYQLHALAVDPAWQGKGVGRTLMDVVELRALRESRRVLWETITDLDVEIYKRWGGVVRGEVEMVALDRGVYRLRDMELSREARKLPERRVAAILHVMRVSFDSAFILRAVLGSEHSAEQIDALHALFGEGEVWIAEVDREGAEGGREVIGMTIWFLPGHDFLFSEKQKREAGTEEFRQLVGEQRAGWFLDYYVPGIAALWERCCPPANPYMTAYKLSKLGVLPTYHAFGIASDLARPVVQRAANDGQPIYGHATSELHVAGYKSIGCQVLGAEDFGTLTPVLGRAGDGIVGVVRVWAIGIKPQDWLGTDQGEETEGASGRVLARL